MAWSNVVKLALILPAEGGSMLLGDIEGVCSLLAVCCQAGDSGAEASQKL